MKLMFLTQGMLFVLFIGNSRISNIRDYLSNSMDMLSNFVLNLYILRNFKKRNVLRRLFPLLG